MKIFIGGECSGRIRRALRANGHIVYSCDLKPAEDGETEFHIQGHMEDHMNSGEWDAGIFHPTCKYNANSGAKHLYAGMKKSGGVNPVRWALMEKGAQFVRSCLEAEIPRVAVEHPIIHRHARAIIGRDWTQIIQPWQFGHKEMKATCWYLKGFPELVPTDIVGPPPEDATERRAWAKCHREPPGPDREANRSRTLQGYADAIGEQWGGFLHAEAV